MNDYQKLNAVLVAAVQHAAQGKGADRHAGTPHGPLDLDFEDQPMLAINRMVGPGFSLGQSMKKAQEASLLIAQGNYEKTRDELLGAINYLAGAIVLVDEYKAARDKQKAAAEAKAQARPVIPTRPAPTATEHRDLSSVLAAVDKELGPR